jgi:hypothetical protein
LAIAEPNSPFASISRLPGRDYRSESDMVVQYEKKNGKKLTGPSLTALMELLAKISREPVEAGPKFDYFFAFFSILFNLEEKYRALLLQKLNGCVFDSTLVKVSHTFSTRLLVLHSACVRACSKLFRAELLFRSPLVATCTGDSDFLSRRASRL